MDGPGDPSYKVVCHVTENRSSVAYIYWPGKQPISLLPTILLERLNFKQDNAKGDHS